MQTKCQASVIYPNVDLKHTKPDNMITKNYRRLSNADKSYIAAHFVTIDELAKAVPISIEQVHSLILEGSFPEPSYRFEDCSEWFPLTYASLMRRAIKARMTFSEFFRYQTRKALRNLQEKQPKKFRVIAGVKRKNKTKVDELVDRMWSDYKTGAYGVCLRSPVCGSIIKKALLMHEIEELITSPKRGDSDWKTRLKESVDLLDDLELPFSDYDRLRFGKPLSRDRLIRDVRDTFPEVFDSPRRSNGNN